MYTPCQGDNSNGPFGKKKKEKSIDLQSAMGKHGPMDRRTDGRRLATGPSKFALSLVVEVKVEAEVVV